MKSSSGSATLFFSGLFSRGAGLGRTATSLLFSAVLFLPMPAEAGLPRAAVSIPADENMAAGLRAAEQCAIPGKLIVLPPLSFSLLGDQNPASLLEEQAQAVQSMPEGSEAWLHLMVGVGSGAGNESEKRIRERVDALVKSMPSSAPAVRGIIVEIETKEIEPTAARDQLEFGLARLALSTKASNAGLRLAFVFRPRVRQQARRYREEACHLFRSAGNDLFGGLAPGCSVDCRTCIE